MEIRLHGRGGQGGVTCAKILAEIYARMGKAVQAFGDYAGERSGAPIRAYARVDDGEITNRNKVYEPDHLLVLDPTLLGPLVVGGLKPGGILLVNTEDSPDQIGARFPGFRPVTVDATAIARRHGIGTRSVVIVNTTLAGAFARAADVPFDQLEAAYEGLGLAGNLGAAREAWEQARIGELEATDAPAVDAVSASPWGASAAGPVPDLVDQRMGPTPTLKTGAWRSQAPRYRQRLAPCNASCPAGNDVVGFVQALLTEGPGAAAAILARTTPLPGVCGRVCPGFCMAGCNRAGWDGAVDVRGLERWVANEATGPQNLKTPLENPRRFAVLGSGPAGLSAAHHLALRGHSVVLIEGEPELGGVLRTGIPEYRLPRDVLTAEIDRILELGVEARTGVFLGPEQVRDLALDFDGLILATGLQRLRALDVDPLHSPWIDLALRFLGVVNATETKGSVADSGSFIRADMHVVVLGGGNTAIDCARTALRCGAERVTVAYRRDREAMPAIDEEVQEALDEGVRFRFLSAPAGFVQDERGRAVLLADVELGEPDGGGRRAPIVTDRVERFPCDRVLLALGQSPDTSLLPFDWELRGEQVFHACEPLPVFACGDVATREGTVVHAIGDGHRVATLALKFLGEDVVVFERPPLSDAVPPARIHRSHFDRRAPTPHNELEAHARVESFDEVNRGLPDAGEAWRCFSCGSCTMCDTCLVYCPEGVVRRQAGGYELDLDYCKGCGICVTECPRDAMEMVSS